mmetsp:Transcript_10411/g.24939  ORF Transcript_10411/g.24939 Transcript_10411/m.24939 type:complete len:267 (-) Transcript_10411:12-812(-)
MPPSNMNTHSCSSSAAAAAEPTATVAAWDRSAAKYTSLLRPPLRSRPLSTRTIAMLSWRPKKTHLAFSASPTYSWMLEKPFVGSLANTAAPDGPSTFTSSGTFDRPLMISVSISATNGSSLCFCDGRAARGRDRRRSASEGVRFGVLNLRAGAGDAAFFCCFLLELGFGDGDARAGLGDARAGLGVGCFFDARFFGPGEALRPRAGAFFALGDGDGEASAWASSRRATSSALRPPTDSPRAFNSARSITTVILDAMVARVLGTTPW